MREDHFEQSSELRTALLPGGVQELVVGRASVRESH
jgi:hypothetical protein